MDIRAIFSSAAFNWRLYSISSVLTSPEVVVKVSNSVILLLREEISSKVLIKRSFSWVNFLISEED